MKREIEVLARGVCVRRGRVLLCRTGKAAITYLPGGHVEFGEAAAEALAREIREELGATARVGPFLGGVEHAFVQKGRKHCEINLVFAMAIPELTPDRPPRPVEGHLSFLWVPVRELDRAALEPAPLRSLLAAWVRRPVANRWVGTYGGTRAKPLTEPPAAPPCEASPARPCRGSRR